MNDRAEKIAALAARHPWGHLLADVFEWPKGEELPSEVLRFVRELEANECPTDRALAIASVKYMVGAATIKRWMAVMATLPEGTDESSVLRPAGRPPSAWENAGAEDAYELYLTAYLAQEKPNSAACWREVKAIALERGWIIPSEKIFRLRLRSEGVGAR